MDTILVRVFKEIHNGKTHFAIQREGMGPIARVDSIANLAEEIRSLSGGGDMLKITCKPDCDISVRRGKKPIHYESLSKDEEKELFETI